MMFLPQNPCSTTYTPPTSSCGCGDPCNASPVSTNGVSYSGANLSCTSINTCDSATVAFQKIDAEICSLKQQIINLQNALSVCCPTPTTTTTSTSSTTTTTTTIACPSCSFYSVTNSTLASVNISYYQCGGVLVEASLVGPSTIYVCACVGTLVIPPVPGVTSSNLGECLTTTTTTTVAPTTTTTTTAPTTTTTTTLPPGVYAFAMKYSVTSGTDACNQTTSAVYYSNSATLSAFSVLATDVALAVAAPAGYYCLAIGCPNALNIRWIQVGAFGAIGGSAFC